MDKETLLDTCRVLKLILITVTIMRLLDDEKTKDERY